MPKVSIIVPVYNVDEYLEQCICSLFAQTEQDFEIIAVDDGSTDESGKILDRLADEDARLRVVHKENAGVGAASNLGLDMAEGEWVTFADSDDWCTPNMIERALNAAAENNDYEIVIFSLSRYKGNGIPAKSEALLPFAPGDITNEREFIELRTITRFYPDGSGRAGALSVGATWGKLVRRELVERLHQRFDELLIRAQDTVFWIELFENAKGIFYLDDELYCYRQWNGSITFGNSYIQNSDDIFGRLIHSYESFAARYKKDERFRYAILLRGFNIITWSLKHNYSNPQNKKSLRIRKKEFADFIMQEPYQSAIREVPSSLAPRLLFLLRRRMYFSCILLYSLIVT
ncbi:MAG: glycosyltransferase [Lachnospiraceae bacterium]|nr:glycosyltransferase [Lachnospiraceae bacterium]